MAWYPGKNIIDWFSGWGDDDDDYESEFDFEDKFWTDLGLTREDIGVDADPIIPMPESQWTDDAGYEDWLNSMLDETGFSTTGDLYQSVIDEFTPETGPLGGTWGPWLRDAFLGPGGLRGRTGDTRDDTRSGGIMGLLNSLLGGGGQDGGGLLCGGGLGPLASLWSLNNARKEGDDPGAIIPMGQQAYGMDDVYGGPTPDYRVFNIQPALMPGVAYANVGKPEGMKGGGIASLEGSGDVTPAWLEPGEFVVSRPATQKIGAQNLYRMMKEAEGRG